MEGFETWKNYFPKPLKEKPTTFLWREVEEIDQTGMIVILNGNSQPVPVIKRDEG